MLCSNKCSKKATNCDPISNIISDNGESFVCIGYHNDNKKEFKQDIFRHCFKTIDSDTMYDYDEYDLKSVISVMSEALLLNELK